jgi:hypothetical protein
LSKIDDVLKVVARGVLSVPVGEQIPTTSDLAAEANAGHGTVQTAVRALEDSGSVVLTAHGSFGRRVVSKDLPSLWAACGRGPLTGVMPLPESREFAGLATAFTVIAENHGLPFQLLFRQGSKIRFQFLESSRVEFTVVSQMAAAKAEPAATGWCLSRHTYYGKDSVVVITKIGEIPDGAKRVPIDRNSPDHMALTQREFPNAELVDTPYLFIPELVAEGKLDAAVWHQTTSSPLLIASGLSLHPLSRPALDDDNLDSAAIVHRANDAGVGRLLSEIFPSQELESIQKEVMDGTRIPQF